MTITVIPGEKIILIVMVVLMIVSLFPSYYTSNGYTVEESNYYIMAGPQPTVNQDLTIIKILPTTPTFDNVSSSVACDGGQCCSSIWGCPNLWGVVNIGNASMDPNVWGWQNLYQTDPVSIGTGNTTMWINNGVLYVDSQWNIRTRPLYNVMAYHEVIYGAKPWGNQPVNAPGFTLPMSVSKLPRVLVGVGYTQYSGIPGNNYAFEAWLFPDSNNYRAPGPGDYEIMVQLYIDGGFPAGYDKGPVAVYTIPILVDGILVNQTFELYDVVADAGWRFLTFKSTTNYVNTTIVFDYTLFIEIADQYLGGSLSSLNLMSLEFGTEVYTNRCTGFPCIVDIRWALYEYYYALAPRSMPTIDALKLLAGYLQTGNGDQPGAGSSLYKLYIDFQNRTPGPYTEQDLQADFQNVNWSKLNGRTTIVDENGNRYLRVEYPAGQVGSTNSGASFLVNLPESSYCILEYDVRFEPGFDFSKGGKLPGLTSGGSTWTGFRVPSSGEGWSARFMWRGDRTPDWRSDTNNSDASLFLYLYWMNQQKNYGDYISLNYTVTPGTWYKITEEIYAGTPGNADAYIRVYINGTIHLNLTNIQLIGSGQSAYIDSFYFSTFFGGSSPSWAPSRTVYADFDNINITCTPINNTATPKPPQQPPSSGNTSSPEIIVISYPDQRWPTAELDLDNDGVNDYIIEINPWNIQSATGTAIMKYYTANGTLYYSQNLDNIVLANPGAWVHGYPEIFYGNKPWNQYNATDGPIPLPGRVDSLSDFQVTISYRLNPAPGLPVNLAIESWLTTEQWRTTGVRQGEQEVMIWLYYDGLQPAGSKIGEIIVPIIVNGTGINATFEVWKGNIGWEYIAFRITTPIKAATITLPYGPFISTAANITNIQDYASLYLEDVEVGTEYGSPSTASAHMEWWIYEFTLTPLDRPLLSALPQQPPADESGGNNSGSNGGGSQQASSGSMQVQLVNSWGSGAHYEVSVSLDTRADWSLLVKIADGYIDNSWGVTVNGTTPDGYIVLVAEPWNLGPQASAGFITRGGNPLVTEILLVSGDQILDNWTAPQPSPGSMSVSLVIDSDWNTGFVARIYITNNGSAPITGWYVKLEMTSRITSIWGGVANDLGNGTIIITAADYTSVIAPGETVEIGFVAEKQGDKPYPEIVDYGVDDGTSIRVAPFIPLIVLLSGMTYRIEKPPSEDSKYITNS